MKISLADWKCSAKERRYVNDVLDSGWITYGPFCKKLEHIWANYHGCKHGVINSSGTAALQLAFRALKEIYEWDGQSEIIVPAITFPATINMVIESGLKPVLADVELDGMIDVKDVENKITKNTKGLCLVHLWGLPYPRIAPLIALCKKHKIRIVEDSCETIDPRVGNIGEVSCFSMYFNHIISAGVGGMACTNNQDIANVMRSLANHGMEDTTIIPKYKRFNFCRVGYSMRVTEMEAALGLAQFERIGAILAKRKQVSECMTYEMKKNSIHHIAELLGGTMMYPIVFTDIIPMSQLMSCLNEQGIETRTMLPITNQSVFKNLVEDYEAYPMARTINNRGIFFPIHPRMTGKHCAFIAKNLKNILSKLGFKTAGALTQINK